MLPEFREGTDVSIPPCSVRVMPHTYILVLFYLHLEIVLCTLPCALPGSILAAEMEPGHHIMHQCVWVLFDGACL